jgi:hypothetical protein
LTQVPHDVRPEASTVPTLPAALALHGYLERTHVRDGALIGPDPGVRLNYRVGRFLKNYVRFVPWRDDSYYLQAQGYWILANWRLFDLTGEPRHRDAAVAASRQVVSRQAADGSWSYPSREWGGRVATAEGSWACIGLLETARRTGDGQVLDSVRRWRGFLDSEVGYVELDDATAVHYFARRPGLLVPNNSALAARLLAESWALDSSDDELRERVLRLVRFVGQSQLPSGELPYTLPFLPSQDGGRLHFQCYQYNAFQLLDLLRCYELIGAPDLLPTLQRLASFVQAGVDSDGRVFFNCTRGPRRVVYHTGVVAAALDHAFRHGLIDGRATADLAYRALLAIQRPDGSLPYSRGDYAVLRDGRSYPRSLAFVLLHLLIGSGAGEPTA